MHRKSRNYKNITTNIAHRPAFAGQSGAVASSHESWVLSRKDLQRLVLDMVG